MFLFTAYSASVPANLYSFHRKCFLSSFGSSYAVTGRNGSGWADKTKVTGLI